MFNQQKVKELNDLELLVYEFILKYSEQVTQMTIRELAQACHVSQTTVFRTCFKLGFSGYGELKFQLKVKKDKESEKLASYYENVLEINKFLKRISEENYKQLIDPCVKKIEQADYVVFYGIGTSGALAKYGARYFANLGINAYAVSDPYYPVAHHNFTNALAIVLSVSGETLDVLTKVSHLKNEGATILSLTNNENSTIAKLADFNLSYYMPDEYLKEDEHINLTTQIPVVALIEILANRIKAR